MPSTVIRGIDYDAGRRRLKVRFVSGALYAYDDVPPKAYEAFRAASSKGRYFSTRVRDRYPFHKLEDPSPDGRLAG